jgi:hypothetical protein
MAVETSALVADVLKSQFPIKLVNTVIRHGKINKYLPKKMKSTFGRKIEIPHKLQGNPTATVVGERGALPDATSRLFDRTEVYPKAVYQPLDLSGLEIILSKGEGAFVDLFVDAIADASESLDAFMDCYAWGNGSGRIAQIDGTPSYASPYSTVYITPGSLGNIFHFMEGQYLSSGTDTTAYQIKEVDLFNNKLTIIGDVSGEAEWADTKWLYRYGSYAATFDSEPTGIGAHVLDSNPASGAYQGIDRTAAGTAFARAYVQGTAGDDTLLNSAVMDQFFMKIFARSKRIPRVVLVGKGVWGSWKLYLESRSQQVREIVDKVGTKGALSFVHMGEEITLELDLQTPVGEMVCLEPEYLPTVDAVPVGWLTDLDGSARFKMKEGYHVYQGYLFAYYNMVGTHNKAFGRLLGIKEDSIS